MNTEPDTSKSEEGPEGRLNPYQIIEIKNHMARAIQTANNWSENATTKVGEQERVLWKAAAQKLIEPEPWMNACCGYKLFQIGDGGKSLQTSMASENELKEALDCLIGKNDKDIINFKNKELLVDTCVRLAIGYTMTEKELMKSISDEQEKISSTQRHEKLKKTNITNYDTEWAKALNDDELEYMYAIQTALIIVETYATLQTNGNIKPADIYTNIRKASQQIPDTVTAFFKIARGRHENDNHMQVAHEAAHKILADTLEEAKDNDIDISALTLEYLWNFTLNKAEEEYESCDEVVTDKEDWAKSVGLKAWSELVFLKALCAPGTAFLAKWYIKQMSNTSIINDIIPAWMKHLTIHNDENNSWRSVRLQSPPVIRTTISEMVKENNDI